MELDFVRIHEAFDAGLCKRSPYLTDLPGVIVDLGPCGHVRLQDLYFVGLQEFVNRVFGILQIDQLTGACGAASQQAVVKPFVMR